MMIILIVLFGYGADRHTGSTRMGIPGGLGQAAVRESRSLGLGFYVRHLVAGIAVENRRAGGIGRGCP